MYINRMVEMEVNEDVAYVAGFVIGDGNLSKSYLVRAVEENALFINLFSEIFQRAFNERPKIYFDHFNNSFVAYLYSRPIWEFLVNELNIPSGNKSRTVRIPSKIISSEMKIKTAFLSGIFDAEGSIIRTKDSHHPNGYTRIQFKVHNNELAEDIYKLLLELKFKPRIYKYPEFSMVNLHGTSQCQLFLEKIGFKHPIKSDKLRHFLLANNGAGSSS